MWKIAHGKDKNHCDHQGSRAAIRIKINSPAYMLPNSRSPKEIGLDIRLTISSRKFIGAKAQ